MLVKLKTIQKINTIAYVSVLASSNNTLLNISTLQNKTIYFGSAGLLGIKGSRRSTSYAGQSIAYTLGKKLYISGVRFVYVKLKGFGQGRQSSLKGLYLAGLKILRVLEITPIPFNGCRPPKKRRM